MRRQIKNHREITLPPGAKVYEKEKKGKIHHKVDLSKVKLELDEERGYYIITSYDVDKLFALKEQIIEKGIVAYDYETDGDPNDTNNKTFEQKIVGVSFCCKVGVAYYLPIAHDNYVGNWDLTWLVTNFLKPVLEHPDVYVIAHHIAVEYTLSILCGVDLYPKARNRMVMDTMYMIKAVIPNELLLDNGALQLGLKPAAKAILADQNGMVNGLLHVDDIKSFKETVGYIEKQVPTGEFTKKGKPKMKTIKVYRRFNQLPVDKHVIDYACSDSDWSLSLFYKLAPSIDAEGLWDLLYDEIIPFALIMAECEMVGWRINRKVLDDYKTKAEKALYGYTDENGNYVKGIEEQLMDELQHLTSDKVVPAGKYPMEKYRNKPVFLEIKQSKEFSWNSVKHLQWLYYHVLELPILKRSKRTFLPSTDAETTDELINEYGDQNKFLHLLKQKRNYDKLLSTYVLGYEKCLKEDDRLHSSLKRVDTWRLSSSAPNLQNIPKPYKDDLGIRKMFEAPKYDLSRDYSSWNPFKRPPEVMFKENWSGETLYISADYSQIELRVLAWMSDEPAMLEAFRKGLDIHSMTAKDMFQLQCDVKDVKEKFLYERYAAKAINFGIVYGITEQGLVKHPDLKGKVTVQDCKNFIERYKQRYVNVPKFMKYQIEFARQHKYVMDGFGHRRPIPMINHPNAFQRQLGERKAINTPIQATAAGILCLAQVRIRDNAPKRFPKGAFKMVMPIHDDLISEVPVEIAMEALHFQQEMQEAHIDGISDHVPIIVDPAIGKTWGRSLEVSWNGHQGIAHIKQKDLETTWKGHERELELIQKAGFEIKIN